jgi:hypothetical protein
MNLVSDTFRIKTGVRRGGILSPFLFRLYVVDIRFVTSLRVGCNLGGKMINFLCFVDDMVLLAASWRALQCLIDVLYMCAKQLNMSFNVNKSVCMVFYPSDKKRIVCCNFPMFNVGDYQLKLVSSYKYLDNIILSKLRDDEIEREIHCLYARCNILLSVVSIVLDLRS